MSEAEVDEFLATERTCRVATSSIDGPHLTALWYIWHGGSVWLHSLYRSQRWADVRRSPRVSVLVDAGTEYAELRGVEICGDAEMVGEVPWVGDPVTLRSWDFRKLAPA